MRCGLVAALVTGLLPAGLASGQRADERPAPSAQDKRAAARAFAEGQQAFRKRDYSLAAEKFEEAHRLAPHHSAVWNAARSRQRAGDLARAANLYAAYIEIAPPHAWDRNRANTELQKLTEQLGKIEIHVIGEIENITIDGEPGETGVVFVTPGTHVIAGEAPDGPVTHKQSVEAGKMVSVLLEPPPPPEPEPPPPPKKEKPAPKPPDKTWSPTVVYVGGGVTAAAALFTVWSGMDTLDQRETFDASPTQANLDEGKSRQSRTNVGLGVTFVGAALTTAAAMWLVDWDSGKTNEDAGVEAGLGPRGVCVRGRF